MTQAEKKERKVLIVDSVGRRNEPSAGNPVISFGAHEEGDETARKGYETWSAELVDMVVAGARLDCEITYKPKGEEVINRVTQMFDNKGNPIRQGQKRAGGGGGGYGKSDYQVGIERTSIEGQTAYNGIIELLKAQTIDLDHTQSKTAMEYGEKKMREGMKIVPAAAPSQPTVKVEPKSTAPPAAKQEAKITEEMINHLSQVAKEKGYKHTTIAPLITSFGVDDVKDLTVAQGKQLLAKIEKGEGLVK